MDNVLIPTEKYERLIKRSFALDIILGYPADSAWRLEESIKHIKKALLPAEEESEAAEDA